MFVGVAELVERVPEPPELLELDPPPPMKVTEAVVLASVTLPVSLLLD